MRPNLWKPIALVLAVALGVVIGRGTAQAGQPHMQNALWLLGDAKASLSAAEADKAGHRARAIDMVAAAMRETQEGIAAGAH